MFLTLFSLQTRHQQASFASLPNTPAFHHCNGIEPNGVQAGYNTKPAYEARGRIRKAYNRADYLEERAEMFQ